MNKFFDFKEGDVFTYRRTNCSAQYTDIVAFVKNGEKYDTLGTTREFLYVYKDEMRGDYNNIELLEVFRRDGDIYRKIFMK